MFCCLLTPRADVALAVARACSPHLHVYGPGVVFDVSGCSRTIGPPETIGKEVYELAVRGSEGPNLPRVSVAPTVTMSWLLAHARSGVTVVTDTVLLARLPVGWLKSLVDLENFELRSSKFDLAIFERWGLRTLGEVASLPRADVLARLGPIGRRLHQAACGEDASPFVPMDEPATFVERQELEWPIEGLEPLAFVLSRLCDRLSLMLRRADRGAVTIQTSLGLVTREAHDRTLRLPSPMADSRILRTLILLDLESHPPPAAIDVVTIDLEVSPGPIAQGSLIAPTLPTPEDLATLVARLTALVGASRVGAPVVLDTHDARAVGMGIFRAEGRGQRAKGRAEGKGKVEGQRVEGKGEGREAGMVSLPPLPSALPSALRRFRLPIAARVEVEHRRPVRVAPAARGLPGGRVVGSAGPWRSSGGWWTFNRAGWDRDEWDVELATGDVYRIARDRCSGQWVVEGIID